MYLIDTTNMGRFDPGNDAVVQSFQVTDEAFQRNIHGSPVWWWGPAGGRMYVWGEAEELKSYAFDGVGFDPTPVGRGPVAAPGEGAMPGGIVTLSANGSQAGTGIVWATVPRLLDALNQIVPGVLHAFDAEDVSRELWNSDLDPGDELGMFAKFTPPIVVNGKVFAATFSGVVRVYGLRYGPPPSPPPPADSVPAPWASDDIGLTGVTGAATGDGTVFTVDGAGSNIWGSSDTFHFVYCTFSGDAEIVARVTSLDDTNTFAKAGVMMRASAAPGAAHVILDVRPTGDIEFMTRSNDGGQTSWLGGSVQGTPVWLRLRRIESTVTASISGDGEAWRDVGSASLENATLAGLAVTSANASTLNRATFDNVAIEVTVNTAGALSPYNGTPVTLPGLVQAEEFDNGPDGVAYHDESAGNSGGVFRATAADIEATTDDGGGYDVGWVSAGEWLNYSVNVASAGAYTVQLRVASPGGGVLHVGFNGTPNVWTPVDIPATGGWQQWTTVALPVALGSGPQLFTLVFDTDGFNVNYIEVTTN